MAGRAFPCRARPERRRRAQSSSRPTLVCPHPSLPPLSACLWQVPATDMEALNSPLLTLFEKNRARLFFKFVQARGLGPARLSGQFPSGRVTPSRELLCGAAALRPRDGLTAAWSRPSFSSPATCSLTPFSTRCPPAGVRGERPKDPQGPEPLADHDEGALRKARARG